VLGRLLKNHIVADLAATAAGVVMAYKGVSILSGTGDPNVTPVAMVLFSIGLIGLRLKLGGRTGPIGRLGGGLAWIALLAAGFALGYSLMYLRESAATLDGEPWPFRYALLVALAALFFGSALLGVALLRRRALPSAWRGGVAAACMLWFPALTLGWLAGVGQSFVLLGVVWFALGALLASRTIAGGTAREVGSPERDKDREAL
jgi:hypothetical protein